MCEAAVAEHVRPGQLAEQDAGAREVALHDLGDRRGLAEGLDRSGEGEKHSVIPVTWAAVLEILGQSGADFLGRG